MIKNADLKDIKNISRLLFELYKDEEKYDNTLISEWANTDECAAWIKEDIENNCVLVATENDEVVGFLIGEAIEENNISHKRGDLIFIYSNDSKTYDELFEEFKKWCIGVDIKDITIVSSFENKKEQANYKKYGFKEFETVMIMNIEEGEINENI